MLSSQEKRSQLTQNLNVSHSHHVLSPIMHAVRSLQTLPDFQGHQNPENQQINIEQGQFSEDDYDTDEQNRRHLRSLALQLQEPSGQQPRKRAAVQNQVEARTPAKKFCDIFSDSTTLPVQNPVRIIRRLASATQSVPPERLLLRQPTTLDAYSFSERSPVFSSVAKSQTSVCDVRGSPLNPVRHLITPLHGTNIQFASQSQAAWTLPSRDAPGPQLGPRRSPQTGGTPGPSQRPRPTPQAGGTPGPPLGPGRTPQARDTPGPQIGPGRRPQRRDSPVLPQGPPYMPQGRGAQRQAQASPFFRVRNIPQPQRASPAQVQNRRDFMAGRVYQQRGIRNENE